MKRKTYCILLLLVLFLMAGCASFVETPRQATREAQEKLSPPATSTRLVLPAPTLTGTPPAPTTTPLAGGQAPLVTIWINEASSEQSATLAEMAAEFKAESGIELEAVQVRPDLLPALVETAVLSDTLPDLILHPLEYTIGWAEDGILDPEAAADAIAALGPETFDPDALALVEVEAGYTGVPSDGHKQLIIYRTDWFVEEDLDPPDSFENLMTAASTLYFTPTLTAGIVAPTESDLVTTHYVFEQMAIANGCHLIDEKGEVMIQQPACLEALDFYHQIINQYSPSDVQTDISALNAYLAGRAGLVIAPPAILPQLAGLDPGFPLTCPGCDSPNFLVENTAFITELAGGDNPLATTAGLGTFDLLGITTTANREAAIVFAQYWFNEGYLDWLAVEPARQVPLRLGTSDAPRRFIDAWAELPLASGGPSINELYGPDVAQQLSSNIATPERWGFSQGQGELMATLFRDLTFSILLQEMLSGYFTSSQTITEAYKRVTTLIPNYAYYPTPTATATPEAEQ